MSEEGDRRGIGAVDIAVAVLRAFAAAPGPLSLTEVSAATGLSPSRLHRYLASLVDQGLLAQRERSAKYDLGPFAAALGLAALGRSDFVNAAAAALPALVDRVGSTALLAVWGAGGPTVVRWERGRDHVVTALGLGTVLPLLTSATGRVFLAHLPDALTRPLLPRGTRREAAETARAVRAAGYAAVDGSLIPGLVAVAAPVLNWQGEAEAAITLISTDPALIAPDGTPLANLRESCAALSSSGITSPQPVRM
jgi:DNA-binding IclR family transcriptional regulator